MREALIVSALESAAQAVRWGLPGNRIVLSCKVSGVQDLIWCIASWRGAATTRCIWA